MLRRAIVREDDTTGKTTVLLDYDLQGELTRALEVRTKGRRITRRRLTVDDVREELAQLEKSLSQRTSELT